MGSRAQESNWQMVGDSHDENSVDRLQLLQLSEPESDFLSFTFSIIVSNYFRDIHFLMFIF